MQPSYPYRTYVSTLSLTAGDRRSTSYRGVGYMCVCACVRGGGWERVGIYGEIK